VPASQSEEQLQMPTSHRLQHEGFVLTKSSSFYVSSLIVYLCTSFWVLALKARESLIPALNDPFKSTFYSRPTRRRQLMMARQNMRIVIRGG
jgi:hypothetical protein